MERLIDADRLKAHYCWWAGGSKEMSIDEAKKTFDTIIDVQPTVDIDAITETHEKIGFDKGYRDGYAQATVDAEPVRHGKWTHTKGSNMRHDYTCSLCGCRITGVDPFSLSATAFYYCPECGANMDEVENAE